MKTKIILFGCTACFIFWAAKCNQQPINETREKEKKKTESTQPDNSGTNTEVVPPVDPMLTKIGGDTVKVYHDYIKDHIDSFSRLIQQYPEEAEYYLRRGDLKVAQGDNAGGCEDYRKAKSLGSKNMQILFDKYCK